MKFLTSLAILVLARSLSFGSDSEPEWAYGTAATSGQPPATSREVNAAGGPASLPGSALTFTHGEIGNPFGPADWFPNDHPSMPPIVANGRKPDIWACALCHYPNGKGRPENAGVTGLPVSYFVQQMQDFKNGQRRSADLRKRNTNLMIAYAKGMTNAEVQAAAEYFGNMKWTPWIRVVETKTVPRTRLSVGMYLPLEGAEKEPIGDRIIEVPENPVATEELRNPRSGFLAYVPVGSVKKGEVLVKTGAGKTTACGLCHGVELNGMGPVPGIAGRSPSYLVRELYDIQQGTRSGEWTQLMKPVVSRLSNEDMLNIAAYTASLQP